MVDREKTEDKPTLLNEKGEAKPEGAPEKYAFKAPEGYDLDVPTVEKASAIFKDLGLSNAQAQRLVDFYAEQSKEMSKALDDTMTSLREEWRNEITSDPDLGRKLPEVKATVAKAIDSLGDAKLSASFREAMDLTGAGDHPAFIRAFYKLAQRVTEGSHVSGTGPSKFGQARPGAPTSAASAMYPNLP